MPVPDAVLTAAGRAPSPPAQVIKDDLGRPFTLPERTPARIVSMAPNVTEILFALGLGPNVVGVTRFCDYPPEARTLPKIGGLVDPNIEIVQSLRPDLVVAFRGNPLRVLDRLADLRLPVFILDIGGGLDALAPLIARIGLVTRREKEASALAASLKARQAAVASALGAVASRPRVFVLLYGQGLWTCGGQSYLNDLIARAGAVNIAAAAAQEMGPLQPRADRPGRPRRRLRPGQVAAGFRRGQGLALRRGTAGRRRRRRFRPGLLARRERRQPLRPPARRRPRGRGPGPPSGSLRRPVVTAAARRRLVLALLVVAAAAGFLLSLLVGPAATSPGDLWRFLTGHNPEEAVIFLDLRLARAVLAFLVGASLALSGAILQGYFQNPMADPFVVGVSSGASLGAVLALALGLRASFFGFSAQGLLAFASGLGIVSLVYALSLRRGMFKIETLLLTGIAAGALASSLTSFLLFMRSDSFDQAVFWLLGSFQLAGWREAATVGPWFVVSLARLGLAGQGHEPPRPRRRAGPGPRLPGPERAAGLPRHRHTARRPVGLRQRHHRLRRAGRAARRPAPHRPRPPPPFPLRRPGRGRLPPLLRPRRPGPSSPSELPIGVITAAVGAPFFLYLLHQKR